MAMMTRLETTQPNSAPASHRGESTGPQLLARHRGHHGAAREWPRLWGWLLAGAVGLVGAFLLSYSLYSMGSAAARPEPAPAPPPVACELDMPVVTATTDAHRAMP